MGYRSRLVLIAAACSVALVAVPSARAQPHRPMYGGPIDRAVQFRLGGFFPDAKGGLWEANETLFTLDGSDFDEVAAGFTYVHAVSNYLEVGANIDFYGETVLAADRDFVDTTGAPIFHDTELSVVPVTLDVRFLPAGRYRMRGDRRVMRPAFYFGGGLGFNLWEYEEFGDFVDTSSAGNPIIFTRYKDSGAAFEVHALAGVEFPINPRFNVLVEGRHSWSEAEPDESYAEFFYLEPGADTDLELDGTSVFAGVSFRF